MTRKGGAGLGQSGVSCFWAHGQGCRQALKLVPWEPRLGLDVTRGDSWPCGCMAPVGDCAQSTHSSHPESPTYLLSGNLTPQIWLPKPGPNMPLWARRLWGCTAWQSSAASRRPKNTNSCFPQIWKIPGSLGEGLSRGVQPVLALTSLLFLSPALLKITGRDQSIISYL
jgi:hypothetical protein